MASKKRKGSALVMVIITMLVLAILGAALLNVSVAESKEAGWQDRKMQAHYIARSGVYVGVKMINDLAATSKYPDLTTLTAALNNENTNRLSQAERTVLGSTGYFALSFEITPSGKLKIISTGNTGGTQNTTDIVTMDMDISTPPANLINPAGWVPGNSGNLDHGANVAQHSQIRNMVTVSGKNNCIKSPMGGGLSPVFQASSIKFTNSFQSGFSLEQISNTVPTTFDAQILYFESKVLLNKTNDAVNFTVSDAVLQNWRLPNGTFIDISSDPSNKQGFASTTGYGDFIQGFTQNLYNTSLSGRYGVVYFGGPICRTTNGQNYVELINGGWYYFKTGTNLQTAVVGTDLIPISNPDDAIIKAVLSMLSFSGGTTNQMWDNK